MSGPVDVLRIIDQTDAALMISGLKSGNILRVELSQARANIAKQAETRSALVEALKELKEYAKQFSVSGVEFSEQIEGARLIQKADAALLAAGEGL